MTRPRVAVASLGGTITMTAQQPDRGVQPSLGARDLVAAVPQLGEVAEVEARTLLTSPGASLRAQDVLAALGWARDRAAGVAGVVLVQGTDTIEETAYLLDLFWDRPQPLVVTGAMRPPAAPGADGPANLVASAVVAGASNARDLGVLVVLDDVVHAASRVRKSDSTATGAFTSGPFGPVGRVHERLLTVAARPGRWPALPLPRPGADPRVVLLETHLADDGHLLRLADDAGCDGVVVAGFGAGHLSAAMADVVADVASRVPVVLASRTGAGPVLTGTYGFPGSEQDLIARGAVPAGWLDGRKARLLLWALLAAGTAPVQVRRAVRERGAAPGGPGE